MAETAFAPASGIAQEALKMLFALDVGGIGNRFGKTGTFPVEARSALEEERLELLECVNQELGRAMQSAGRKPGLEVCADLLAHLAGCPTSEWSATIH